MEFSAAYGKEHGAFYLAAQKLNTVHEMVLSHFLTGNSSQAYQRYIRIAKFLLHRYIILKIIEEIDGKEKKIRFLGILRLHDGTLTLWQADEGLLLVCVRSDYAQDMRMAL